MAHAKALLASLLVLSFAAPVHAQIRSEFYIPVPENEALEALDDVNANADDPVQTYVSLTIPNDCRVYYDHWEDGYEVVLDAPVQGSTLIWGNGNGTDGVPPGFGSDPNPIPGGTVLVLANAVSTGMTTGDEDPNGVSADNTLQGTIDFDGRDRVGLTCASAMTRAAWASNSGTLNAGAVEVWAITDLGMSYELPIGQNTPNSDQDFEITNISIMAFEDGTGVDIDHDADGIVDISTTLNQGETYYVDSSSLAVNAGATVTATARVQVHLMTGDVGSSYEARWYTVLPVSSWDSCYTTPTNSQPGATATRVFLYNPNGSAIDVDTEDGTGATSTVSVPANGSAFFDMPGASVGVEFCSDDGSPFYAGAAVDHGSQTHDWGHALVPVELQTNQLLIPWADGCDPTLSCSENGSPVWVTPVCDTFIYADFDQDGTPDKIDLNGDGDTADTVDGHSEATSDLGISVARLDRLLVHDPSDGSQTGALIYSLDAANNSGDIGCDLAGVWGQNGDVASGGTPAIDVGTLIVPFGADVVIEKATNGEDADAEQQAVLVPIGDPVTWTYAVTNTGDFPLENAIVTDDQLLDADISCDASSVGDGTDLDGNNIIDLFNPGEIVTCTASGVAIDGRYSNLATVTGTPSGVTGLPALFDATDTDPSNYFGYDGSIEVVKDLIPALDPGLFDLQLGGVTEAADVTDGGTTGSLDVDPGVHSAGEIAGTGTSLSHYDSDITCVENVGRCSTEPAVACLDDSFCDTTCDLTPYIVANCTDCTSLDVTVPAAESDIVCTITNTNKCEGVVCGDGLFCNGGETCEPTTGACDPGAPVDCDDGVSCTNDSCDEGTDQCVNAPVDAVCSDGAFCNGVETCDPTSDCQAGTPVDCADGISCTNDVCDEGTDQCVNAPVDAVCNDGAFCNGVETCDPTSDCQAGTPVDCADGVSCTDDVCDEGTDQCVNSPVDAVCSDGAFCNGVETCDPTNDCQAGVPPVCDDGVGCTVDACDDGLGACTNVPDETVCDDGSICTLDVCDAVLGCQNPVDNATCGNECELEVTKGAEPIVVPGSGDVNFTFTVTNLTVPPRDLTLTSLTDDVFGNLQGLGDCPALPLTLTSGQTLSCSTVQTVTGPTGEFHVNTVSAGGVDSVSTLACVGTAQAEVDVVEGDIDPACRHACHVRIVFRQTLGKTTKPDLYRMNGSLDLPDDLDATLHDFTLTISNQHGVVYTDTLPAGSFEPAGSKFAYKNKDAKNSGGVFLLKMWPYKRLGNWRFRTKAYGDFSGATEEEMTITIQVGPYTFTHTDTWTQLKKGWQLRFNL